MHKTIRFSLAILLVGSLSSLFATETSSSYAALNGGEYTVVVEGYDWGPAVSKVILSLDESATAANMSDYSVAVKRSTACFEIAEAQATGSRTVLYAYVSDAKGKVQAKGSYITLVLAVAPNMPLASPIQYSRNENCRGNNWIDYKLTITHIASKKVWNKEVDRIIPLIDDFDLSGKFEYGEGQTMSYASFTPQTSKEKSPLIIWLHGGGEGGTDPSIPLIANRAANYASEEIQAYFGGAYVLVPQCPGAWMHNAKGVTTHGEEDDIYNQPLMALIKEYVAAHPKIDTDRIYLGGCSNGGYMTLKLILLYPDFFAAGFPSALAYQSEFITDQQIERIKQLPIWFIQSKDDPVTIPEKTVIPVYQRLKAAGAPDVHFTFYDHVVDLSGFFGGENYHYNGHWSWIYSHANHCKRDLDGTPVTLGGRPVTIMEWLAAKTK